MYETQAWDAVFHHQMNTEKRIENTTNFEVFHLVIKHCVERLILLSNKIILEGEIKDTKMSSFSSDFQTLLKHLFPLYFLD